MGHLGDESCIAELLVALSDHSPLTTGSSDLTLCEGFLEVRCRPLDGRAVCAATRVDGVLWVVIDLDKPDALRQAWEMLEEWRSSHLRPMATEAPSGPDELLQQTDGDGVSALRRGRWDP